MAKKTQKRKPEPPKRPKPRTAMRKDVRAALKDKSLSKLEGRQLAANHGMKAAQKVAKKFSSGEYVMKKDAGKALGLRYREGRGLTTFDPRAFGKKRIDYQRVGLGSFGAAGFPRKQVRWKYPQNAPGKGWYVKGYRKGEDGSDIPIYAYGGPASNGRNGNGRNGNGRNGNGRNGNGRNGNGRNGNDWWYEAGESIDPLEEQIWQQAQDSMNQIDYFDNMLRDMLAGIGDLNSTGPGFGYTVGVTGSDGPTNTYQTDPLGRPLPEASSLSIALT